MSAPPEGPPPDGSASADTSPPPEGPPPDGSAPVDTSPPPEASPPALAPDPPNYPRPSARQSAQRAAGMLALVLALAWAWVGTVETGRLGQALPRVLDFIGRLVPPDLSVTETVVRATFETIQIALLGTAISALASLPLGLAAAVNLSPAWIHQPTKWMLGVLRGIPILLLALMFVTAVGLGPFPGVLAVAVHSTGMLGKFYAEAFENARGGVLEALDSTGGSWLQVVRFGVFPQVAPDLARDTMFRFELNLRESLVLGLVGAGGIGLWVQSYIRSFQYAKVGTLTIVVLLMVVVVEQASVAIRKRLR